MKTWSEALHSSEKTWKSNKKFQIKRKERKRLAVQVNVFSSMSSWQNSFLFLIFNHPPYFSTFPFGPWSKKGFKLACNWSSNFKHLAIMSLQIWAKILLAAGIPTFMLDIQTGIL